MFTPEQYQQAAAVASDFNRRHGGELLRVAELPPDYVTLDELRALARSEPGEYVAKLAYARIKGRNGRHGELVRLGHLLGHLSVARRKDGPHNLWRLDNAFAQRSN